MRRFLVLLAAAAALATPEADYRSAKRKIDLIQQDQAPPGARVTLKKNELNAWVRREVADAVPEGVRDPRLVLGVNRATGYAYVDFAKLRRAQGQPMNWFLEKLLGGESPVRVDARIRSADGQAQVDLDRVEISGLAISGDALDWLIRNFLWSYYPEAKVGKPFELAHRIERLEVTPAEVRVVIGR